MKIYSFGYGGSVKYAEELRPIIEQLGHTLITISEWPEHNIKYDYKTINNELKNADIVILPCNYKEQSAKSANRLIQAFSLGKPVICSPLLAYLDVLNATPNGYAKPALVATTTDEWALAIKCLLEKLALLESMSISALKIAENYTIDKIVDKWKSILYNTTDIVIPTYKNLRGLKLCINSIRANTKNYKIIVVNNGSMPEMHDYLSAQSDITYVSQNRLSFAQAINLGVTIGTSKYVLLMNDDVIVSKGWLSTMISSCTKDIGSVGPLSNCDKGWMHNYSINISGVELLPGANTFEQIEPIIQNIYAYVSPYNEIIEREWVAAYCTLITRSVINEGGLMNEKFTKSGEDVDLCLRIRKQGYKIIQNFNSFVFHMGAISRKTLESENKEVYQAEQKSTNEFLQKLYNKKSVVIYTSASWEKWNYNNLETGIGGSECWAIYLSREFEKLGYRVTVFADTPEQESNDGEILWLHYSQFKNYAEQNYIDYFISSRTEEPFQFKINSGKNFVQAHDIWLLSGQKLNYNSKIKAYCCLSEWHKEFFANHHSKTIDKQAKSKIIHGSGNISLPTISITANGIDLNRFNSVVERNPYRLHYSSSWDRGLDNILYLWPFLKERIPELELHVFYGVYNWKKMCEQRNDKQGLEQIAKLESAVKQPGIFTYGRVSQKELAIEMQKASLFLYPTSFSETFCITAIECQVAGVPVIASNYAGLKTTIDNSGILLGNEDAMWAYTLEGRTSFFNETISILKDKEKWSYWSEKGKQNANKYTWTNCALNWKKMFEE